MPDLQTRLPDLLRGAAGGAPTHDRTDRTVLRRARRRRVVNGSAVGLAAIMIVAGTVLGSQVLLRSDGVTVGDESSPPAPPRGTVETVMYLPGAIWPEITADGLATAQAAADDGHQPWRLDPVQTASAFAVSALDWDPGDAETKVVEEVTGGVTSRAVVEIWNRGLSAPLLEPPQPAPVTVVTLEQLGTQGENGVWTVTGVDTDLIDLDPIVREPGSGPVFSGRLVDAISEWTPAVWTLDPTGLRTDGNRGSTRHPDDTFRAWIELPEDLAPFGTASIGALVALHDPEGTIVAADGLRIDITASDGPTPTGAVGPSGTTGPTAPIDDPPSAVLATRDAIAGAAEGRDWDALEALIDPNRFSYDFDDGSNPLPVWREDPSVLDMLVTILGMPFTTNRDAYPEVDPASPTVYIWPSLMGSNLADLSAGEQAMLDELGITARDVDAMLDAFGGYVGPRTGIAEDGTWLFYTTGGD